MPFFTPSLVFSSAILLRAILLLYGLFQDAHSSLPYTDIDYFVFTDAARYVSRGHSPYRRETYRYTPLLAWLLLPTTWPGAAWFSFGKVMFAVADIVAGWLMVLVLQSRPGGGMESERALKFASIWLLNPMVATISTRGSSEGLLGVMVVALVWAVMKRRIVLAGVLLGLAVHFKIYPFIYGVSMLWYLETPPPQTPKQRMRLTEQLVALVNRSRVVLALSALSTFMVLNIIMYAMYSTPFLTHTYLHHLTRIDHRHNFSPYNTLLHLSSASPSTTSGWHFESLAFIPQLAISAFLIPIALAKKDLPSTMMAQTFAFVAFNKVVTSQVPIPKPSIPSYWPATTRADVRSSSSIFCGTSSYCLSISLTPLCFRVLDSASRPRYSGWRLRYDPLSPVDEACSAIEGINVPETGNLSPSRVCVGIPGAEHFCA